MISIKEVIVVEGRYDKNTLSQLVDAVILETSGFALFHDSQKRDLLRRLAESRGLIVLTDSDSAGFLIRNYIKGCVDPRYVKHAYIPDVYGKERRKANPSREGKLGVEGMTGKVLLDALTRAGATVNNTGGKPDRQISKYDFYVKGLSGKEGSAERRKKLLAALDLPERLSAGAMLDVLNALMTKEEFYRLEC